MSGAFGVNCVLSVAKHAKGVHKVVYSLVFHRTNLQLVLYHTNYNSEIIYFQLFFGK